MDNSSETTGAGYLKPGMDPDVNISNPKSVLSGEQELDTNQESNQKTTNNNTQQCSESQLQSNDEKTDTDKVTVLQSDSSLVGKITREKPLPANQPNRLETVRMNIDQGETSQQTELSVDDQTINQLTESILNEQEIPRSKTSDTKNKRSIIREGGGAKSVTDYTSQTSIPVIENREWTSETSEVGVYLGSWPVFTLDENGVNSYMKLNSDQYKRLRQTLTHVYTRDESLSYILEHPDVNFKLCQSVSNQPELRLKYVWTPAGVRLPAHINFNKNSMEDQNEKEKEQVEINSKENPEVESSDLSAKEFLNNDSMVSGCDDDDENDYRVRIFPDVDLYFDVTREEAKDIVNSEFYQMSGHLVGVAAIFKYLTEKHGAEVYFIDEIEKDLDPTAITSESSEFIYCKVGDNQVYKQDVCQSFIPVKLSKNEQLLLENDSKIMSLTGNHGLSLYLNFVKFKFLNSKQGIYRCNTPEENCVQVLTWTPLSDKQNAESRNTNPKPQTFNRQCSLLYEEKDMIHIIDYYYTRFSNSEQGKSIQDEIHTTDDTTGCTLVELYPHSNRFIYLDKYQLNAAKESPFYADFGHIGVTFLLAEFERITEIKPTFVTERTIAENSGDAKLNNRFCCITRLIRERYKQLEEMEIEGLISNECQKKTTQAVCGYTYMNSFRGGCLVDCPNVTLEKQGHSCCSRVSCFRHKLLTCPKKDVTQRCKRSTAPTCDITNQLHEIGHLKVIEGNWSTEELREEISKSVTPVKSDRKSTSSSSRTQSRTKSRGESSAGTNQERGVRDLRVRREASNVQTVTDGNTIPKQLSIIVAGVKEDDFTNWDVDTGDQNWTGCFMNWAISRYPAADKYHSNTMGCSLYLNSDIRCAYINWLQSRINLILSYEVDKQQNLQSVLEKLECEREYQQNLYSESQRFRCC